MLIIARRQNESIIIKTSTGEEIQILLMNTRQGHAQLGIQAPPDYIIVRDELLEQEA